MRESHEYKQQQLVESLIASLHRETADPASYADIFKELARLLLFRLRHTGEFSFVLPELIENDPTEVEASRLFQDVVEPEVLKFVGKRSPSELHYLYVRLLNKVINTAVSNTISAYQTEEMLVAEEV